MMERVDLSRPGRRLDMETETASVSTDIVRLAASFNRMLERLENERRRSGELVVRAQEEERKRIARDLHDEVNQSLTALLLRIEVAAQHAPADLQEELAETKRLADQAMGELLDLARQLRPTALDDHGLVAALRTHVRDFDRRSPASASFWADPRLGSSPPTRKSSRPGRPGGARQRRAPLRCVARRGDARAVRLQGAAARDRQRLGFAFAEGDKGLGLDGMRERALLVGGALEIDSRPGRGTTVTLELPAGRSVEAPGEAEPYTPRRHEDPDRGRSRDRALRCAAAARPPARHGGGGGSRGRRRRAREGGRAQTGRRGAGRVDAAHDRAAGDAARSSSNHPTRRC